ncbi:MAG: prefoldin subunit alpha [Methanobacteriaceae archaeon]|nr:prefoldin subunit alpha [Methanobacteriaceae archaeon]OPY23340.1 MAG: Prefoldin subunit alpha [Methanobacterium sp. PtaU1.Bin097]
MDDRERLNQLVNELNMYQGQADILNQQMETVQANIADLTIAQETLQTIKDKKDAETLVPIGAGSFIITEIKNTDEVIVGLGAGAAVKKKITEAEESIQEQKKELEAVSAKITDQLNKITDFIIKKTPEAEALIQKLEGNGNQLQ